MGCLEYFKSWRKWNGYLLNNRLNNTTPAAHTSIAIVWVGWSNRSKISGGRNPGVPAYLLLVQEVCLSITLFTCLSGFFWHSLHSHLSLQPHDKRIILAGGPLLLFFRIVRLRCCWKNIDSMHEKRCTNYFDGFFRLRSFMGQPKVNQCISVK